MKKILKLKKSVAYGVVSSCCRTGAGDGVGTAPVATRVPQGAGAARQLWRRHAVQARRAGCRRHGLPRVTTSRSPRPRRAQRPHVCQGQGEGRWFIRMKLGAILVLNCRPLVSGKT